MDRLKEWVDRPTTRAAGLLVAVAVAVTIWGRTTGTDPIGAWIPNIVTGLLSVAATITFVEWIVRREEARQMKPWTERALRDVGGGFRSLVIAIAWDYKATHDATFEPIPSTSPGVLDHWIANVDREDRERAARSDGDPPMVLTNALVSAESLRRVRDEHKEALGPDLVAAIDTLEEDVRMAFSIYFGLADASPGDRAREAIKEVVLGVRKLGETLIHRDRQWLYEGDFLFRRPGTWGTEIEVESRDEP